MTRPIYLVAGVALALAGVALAMFGHHQYGWLTLVGATVACAADAPQQRRNR